MKIGTIVYLNSGGPPMMVVDKLEDEKATVMVTYGDDKGDIIRQGFPAVCVTTINPLSATTDDVLGLIDKWGRDRNIIGGATSKDQLCKLMSEMGELADKGIAKRNLAEIKDGIGDVIVVLAMIAGIENVSVAECIDLAYHEIKDRRGILFDGVFVKESDPAYEATRLEVNRQRGNPEGLSLDEMFADGLTTGQAQLNVDGKIAGWATDDIQLTNCTATNCGGADVDGAIARSS